jgi:uncharacterized protein (DUF1778 family)
MPKSERETRSRRASQGRATKPALKAKLKAASALTARNLSPKEASAMARLEARIPKPLYAMLERAAALRGLTVTAYVTAIMGQDAQRTIEESSIIRLSRDDQTAFAKALIDPPQPAAKLTAAKRRHATLIR